MRIHPQRGSGAGNGSRLARDATTERVEDPVSSEGEGVGHHRTEIHAVDGGVDLVVMLAEWEACLHLGFFLASWGMYRGGTVLLQRSAKYLEPVIEVIAATPEEVWVVDANDYSLNASNLVLEVAEQLTQAFPERASDTLATKIMLGVYGCVPAFDQNLRKGSGLAKFGHEALRRLGRFYEENAEIIERNRVPTLDFASSLRIPTSSTFS